MFKVIYEPVQVLDIREKELGPDHVDVAASLNNIAVLLKTSGQFEEAEEMYTRSIAIKEKALGPNHPQVSDPATVMLYPRVPICALCTCLLLLAKGATMSGCGSFMCNGLGNGQFVCAYGLQDYKNWVYCISRSLCPVLCVTRGKASYHC